jgi:hypothetical protein
VKVFLSTKKYKTWAVAFAVVTCFGTPTPAYAYCATPKEMQALNSSVLVSDLMVAALSCGQQKQYNRFVNKFSPTLVDNNENLQQYFKRYYDKRAELELNRFITRMANLSSRASLKQTHEEYCSAAAQLFKESMALPIKQVGNEGTAPKLMRAHGVKPCGKKFSLGDLFSKNTYSSAE